MLQNNLETTNKEGSLTRKWGVFACTNCGGLVTASAHKLGGEVLEVHPTRESLEDSVPARVRELLSQAFSSLAAPAGSVMLSSTAVDIMLKRRDYTEGSLYARIEKATEDNLISSQMIMWAHDIRLDINDELHADDADELPTRDRAEQCIEFAETLAEFLFVLPVRVDRGLRDARRVLELQDSES